MNSIIKRVLICVCLAGAFAAVSCERVEDNPKPVYLEVNANNISGCWQLVQWNGDVLAAGTEMYIEFIRNDRTFRMWQTMDSFQDIPHLVTGQFNIMTDVEYGAVINGKYDNDEGAWQYQYSVQNLTEDDMQWVAVGDPSFVQYFRRVEKIPYETEKEL